MSQALKPVSFYCLITRTSTGWVYLHGNDRAEYITGDRFPFDSRPYSSRDFIFPFKLKPGESLEVLMNLDKRGETFHIQLTSEGEKLELIVEDDGKGFSVEGQKQGIGTQKYQQPS
jgi:hypothetical protein